MSTFKVILLTAYLMWACYFNRIGSALLKVPGWCTRKNQWIRFIRTFLPLYRPLQSSFIPNELQDCLFFLSFFLLFPTLFHLFLQPLTIRDSKWSQASIAKYNQQQFVKWKWKTNLQLWQFCGKQTDKNPNDAKTSNCLLKKINLKERCSWEFRLRSTPWLHKL